MNLFLDIILFICLMIVSLKAYRYSDRKAQLVGISIVIFVAAEFVRYLLAYIISNLIEKESVIVYILAVLIDVVVPAVLLFVVAELCIRLFYYDYKLPMWLYIIMIACIVVAGVLYYLDLGTTLSFVKQIAEGTVDLYAVAEYTPKFTYFILLLKRIPAVLVVMYCFVENKKQEKNNG